MKNNVVVKFSGYITVVIPPGVRRGMNKTNGRFHPKPAV